MIKPTKNPTNFSGGSIKEKNFNNMEVYDVVEEPVVQEESTMQEAKPVAVEPNEEVKKEGFLTKMWNKTIFPDIIRNMKEEKALKREIKRQARLEALQELKPEMKKAIIQKEKDKMSGKRKKDFLDKLAKGFGVDENGKGLNTQAKLDRMLGTGDSKQFDVLGAMGTSQGSNEMFDINKVLGTQSKKKKK